MIAISVFVFLVLPASASAATYYVSKTGDDGIGDGSVGNPWLTLQYAESTASDGDTVHVAAGTYTETSATDSWYSVRAISWIADGEVVVHSVAAGIRVLALSGTNTASFDGFTFDADNDLDGAKTYAVSLSTGSANKTFSNCVFRDATSALISGSSLSNFNVDNSTFTMNTAGVSGLKGSFIDSVFLSNTFNATSGLAAVRISSDNGSATFDSNTFNITSSSYIWYVNKSGDLTVQDNTFNVTTLTSSGGMVFLTGVGTVDFTGNSLTTADETSIMSFSSGTWDINISDNSFVSTVEEAASVLVEINDQVAPSITNNTFNTQSSAGPHLYLLSSGTDCGVSTISGNTMYSRSITGHVVLVGTEGTSAGDNKLDGVIIRDNVIYGAIYYSPELADSVTAHTIFVGYNKNATIEYNTVIGGGYGVIVKAGGMEYTSGGIFYNKIIDSVGFAAIRSKGVRGVAIENNVVYANSSFAGGYYGIYVGQNSEGETATDVTLRNNILVGGGTSDLIYLESASSSGFSSDYNVLYRHNAGDFGNLSGGYSFSGWQGLGYDANSLNADPLFTDPDNYDVTISYSSPAINAGVDVGLVQDFASVSVPQGASPDVGLYEFYAPDSAPSSLTQYGSDGVTEIVTGDTIYETTVVLKMSMSSSNPSDSLTPQIEIREVGTDFTNVVTNSGNAVVYSGSPVTGTVTISGLADGTYHWQARISNPAGNSSWTSYGGNLESATDFEVSTPTISSLSPLDGAVDVLVDSTLSITFDRTVLAGSGNITVYDSGDAEFESFDVSSDVSGFGTNTISFTPSSILVPATDYYVQVDSTAVVDSDGSVFDGIADSSTWNFTVEGKYDQTITFAALAGKTLGDPSFALTGTASSGLTVSYTSSDESVATVSGSTVTVVRDGTTTITASQSGSVLYNAAPDVAQEMLVVTGSFRAAPPGGAVPAYTYFLSAPAAGFSYQSGESVSLSWNAGGADVSYVRLSFSADNGSVWSQIVDRQPTYGFYRWVLPDLATDQGRLKVEATSAAGSIVASTVLNTSFSISGFSDGGSAEEDGGETPQTPEEVVPAGLGLGLDPDPNALGAYASQSALDFTESIDVDLGLRPVEGEANCVSGSLIKTANSLTVYYCGADGFRYSFPNVRIYYTWFDDFEDVVVVSAEDLARLPLGGNVLYRPGRRMIKIQSDPKVYAVARGGLLRWVTTERVAETLYGQDWNQMIDDVDPAFFFSYSVGDPITESDLGLTADNEV